MQKKYTDEQIAEEAKKYKTRGEFQKNSSSKYNIALQRGLLDEICSHMNYICKPWCSDDLLRIAKKYKTRGELRKNRPDVYSAIHKKKLQETHFRHMIKVRKTWGRKEILKEAKKYKTRAEFEKNNPSAYRASVRLKMKSDLIKILDYKCFDYTDEQIAEEAKKYKTRGEFYRKSPSFHLLASRRKILHKVCKHMKKCNNTSWGEIEVRKFVESLGFSTEKIRRRNIKIEGKPYIKGFDIDIFIKEIGKGIEYDGEYYHSFDYMKKNKPNWELEDIKNYHLIKDDFFMKNEGICILHISDRYWINNRKQAEEEIYNFLSSR
jgi:hypothetical protein